MISAVPEVGQIVRVRQRLYLVEGLVAPLRPQDSTLVELSCVEDDAQGQVIEVLWERELDAAVLTGEEWARIAQRGFDPPEYFSAYLNTLRWNCVTSTDTSLFQSPFRAGTKGLASPLTEMQRLIAKDPRNAERIFPYVGGEEVNDSPTHSHHRYVINFEDFPLRRKESGHTWFGLNEETQRAQLREGIVAPDYPGSVAVDWPDLLAIVEERVRPVRSADNRENYQRLWWQYGERRPGLYRATRGLPAILAINCGATPHLAVAMMPANIVLSHTAAVVALSTYSAFAVLQSRVHEVWARFMASSMKDDLRYTPSDCFKTFPFPLGFETHAALERAGQTYYDFRAALMVRNDEGLTKTYNRCHDPGEISVDIVELRRLQDEMDRVVLDAYGWTRLQPSCDFFPEFEDESSDDQEPSRKKKHFRYRWPDELRDDVLARLLALNQQRYEEEVLAGLHDKTDGARGTRRSKSAAEDEESVEDQRELEL